MRLPGLIGVRLIMPIQPGGRERVQHIFGKRISLQDRDFRLPPVALLVGLRRSRPDLNPAPVDRHHGHRRRGTLRVSDGVLGHERESLVHPDSRVTLVGPLLADPLDDPLDRLGLDVQVGQRGQIRGRLLIGKAVDAGMNDLPLHAWAEARVVNAQRLALREKKPADIGGNWRLVLSRRHLLAWS